MKIFNNKIFTGAFILLASCFIGLLTACSEDENENMLSPLGTPKVSNNDATARTLTFSWEKVDNVSQYFYELRDPEDKVVAADVTMNNRVVFTKLQPNTTYTLNVWAYAAIGSSTNEDSHVATLTATTLPVVALSAPGNVSYEVRGTSVTITWDAVEYASSYTYSYIKDGEEIEGSVSENSLTLKYLSRGDYRLTLMAVPAEDDEDHDASLEVSVTFSITEKTELWSRKGTFTTYVRGDSWDATLVAYDDGSYTIKAWYGVEGYDLEFGVNEDFSIEVLNYEESLNAGYYFVATGRAGAEASRELCTYYGEDPYSEFSGDITAGSLTFYDYGYENYSQFDWEPVTIDDLVGEWNEHSYGPYEYPWSGENGFDYDTNVVTITKVDDQTISISNFFYSEDTFTATVDMTNRTITIPAGQSILTYYTFAQEADENGAVVAIFREDANEISLSGWGLWYGGYSYVEGAVTTLTKQ